MRNSGTPTIAIVSFGYRHAPAPEADITLDLRRALHDPLQRPELRELTGLDDQVADYVMRTAGAQDLATATAVMTHQLATATGRTVTVAFGCAGGRHRSVTFARVLAGTLKLRGHHVQVEHRDVDKPVLAPA